MTEGLQRDQWQHTAQVLCLIANIHRDEKKKKKPFEVKDFYPFRVARQKENLPMVGIDALKKVFVKEKA